jgi:hypothetical protein
MLSGVGNPNIEFNVLGLLNNAHATAAEFLLDAVVRDGAANQGLGVRHVAHILGTTGRQVNEAMPQVAGHLRGILSKTGIITTHFARDLLTRWQAELPTAPTAEHERSLIRFHDICFWIVAFTERFALVLA